MKSNHYTIILLILLGIFPFWGFGQGKEITVTFIGNCGLHLTDGNENIYVDFPYKSGAYNYMEYDARVLDSIPDNSLFLFTHRHADHYSKELVGKLEEENGGKVYGNWNTDRMEEINLNGLSIQPIKTSHKFTFKHYSYVITWHDKVIYISGDTGNLDELSNLKNIDWAFMSPWLFMKAQEEKIKIDTKMIGIYHLYPSQKLPEEVPEHIRFLKTQGEVVRL